MQKSIDDAVWDWQSTAVCSFTGFIIGELSLPISLAKTLTPFTIFKNKGIRLVDFRTKFDQLMADYSAKSGITTHITICGIRRSIQVCLSRSSTEIDILLVERFMEFTAELDFIINYDIKYRMG